MGLEVRLPAKSLECSFGWWFMVGWPLMNIVEKLVYLKSDMCNRCRLNFESLIHLLRDCPSSKAVWEGGEVIPDSKLQWFFNLPFDKWVKENSRDTNPIGTCLNLN